MSSPQRSDSPPSAAQLLEVSSPDQSLAEERELTRRTERRIRADLVESSHKNEIVLRVSGLPRDIDPTKVKMVFSLDDAFGNEENASAEESDSGSTPLRRLKVVSLPRQEKNFKTTGIFRKKFRTPYTTEVSEL